MLLQKLTSANGHATYLRMDQDADQFRKWYDPTATQRDLVQGCGYDVGAGWNPAKCGEPIPCPKHGALVCSIRGCKEPVTEACGDCGSSLGVCGAPLCYGHRESHHH